MKNARGGGGLQHETHSVLQVLTAVELILNQGAANGLLAGINRERNGDELLEQALLCSGITLLDEGSISLQLLHAANDREKLLSGGICAFTILSGLKDFNKMKAFVEAVRAASGKDGEL